MTWTCYVALLLVLTCPNAHVNGYRVIRFGGAGIFFWWQAGAAKYLQQACNLQHTEFLGASAGAIAGSLLLTNVSLDQAADYAINQALEKDIWNRKTGLRGIWGNLVEEFMNDLIPPVIPKDDLARIHIMVTPRLIFRGTKTLYNFESRQEMIDAVLASIHIPFFMDERPWRPVRGKMYLDGSFWPFVTRRPTRLPKHLRIENPSEEVLQIDHKADRRFVTDVDTNNIVRLITPDGLREMMHYGYNYMKDLDGEGKLVFPTSSLSNAESSAKIKEELFAI